MVLYGFRTFLMIVIMVFGIWGDNTQKYTFFASDVAFFRQQFGWGAA